MTSPVNPPPSSPWPYRWAFALAVVTFPLVWWGGFVAATGSGMAFRGWLNADGVFMPFYPWFSSAGDKFIEHGHRVLGMLAGMLTISLVVAVHWTRQPRGVRWFSIVLLAGVIGQGVLGGLRVVRGGEGTRGEDRVIALVHGCTGPLFFAATAAMAVVLSRRENQGDRERVEGAGARRIYRLAAATAGLAYTQLVVGAFVRHSPHLLFEGAGALFRGAVQLHLLLAVVVLGHVLGLAVVCLRVGKMRALAAGLAALIVAQVGLGVATWVLKYGVPRWAGGVAGELMEQSNQANLATAGIVASHGAVGALVVALCVVAAVRGSAMKHGCEAAPQLNGARLTRGALA